MSNKTLRGMISEALAHIKEVDIDQAEKLMSEGYRILDVREPGEYANGTIQGALNIPRGLLEAAADIEFEGANPALRDGRNDNWLVFCQTGGRSALATKTLQDMGFEAVVNVHGGFSTWSQAGKRVVQPS
ncbi:rhodanese-like domain-containing protein [Leucothrix pacifica]|uniref:Sulfurtransferase n=1 Tax=Leucothrix pacifica TaxID=1247513 RepID=A0A317CP47_9GAMM|nr:rhodanese-like domain-containing protein [Leucothrix pacifica]PWR00319.1 sulfurtransferase [Leucothrix pacifica]